MTEVTPSKWLLPSIPNWLDVCFVRIEPLCILMHPHVCNCNSKTLKLSSAACILLAFSNCWQCCCSETKTPRLAVVWKMILPAEVTRACGSASPMYMFLNSGVNDWTNTNQTMPTNTKSPLQLRQPWLSHKQHVMSRAASGYRGSWYDA